MSKTEAAVSEFDFADFEAADTADMTVVVNGKLSSWVWTFAGPGHPQSVEQSNRMARERLHEDRQKEAARVNGKKWKPTEQSPDENRDKNISYVVERLVGWSPVKIGGADYSFSPENARKLLSDPRRVGLLTQAMEFIGDDNAFTQRSATN